MKKREDMLRSIKDIMPKLPKLTKEQKIASRVRSLVYLARYCDNTKVAMREHLDQALGLLEALTTTDDAKEENEAIQEA